MDFDDIFDNDHKKQGHGYGYDHNYRHDEHRPTYSGNNHYDVKQQIMSKLQNNPQLKKLIIISSVIIITVIALLIVVLFPIIIKLFGFVAENGVQGLIDVIWKGTK